MADVKRYEDYGIPLLYQGGWERTGEGNDYIKYADPSNPNNPLRICTLDYVPNLHPNTIAITGISNKEIEVSLLALRNDNYIIAALGWHENGYTFDIGNDYDKLGVMFRYADNTDITPNNVTFDGVRAWVHSLRKYDTGTGWHDVQCKEWDGSEWKGEDVTALLSFSRQPIKLTKATEAEQEVEDEFPV